MLDCQGQIKLKETALKSSENMFLEKENDLNHKIKDLERRLVVLDESTAVSQVAKTLKIAVFTKSPYLYNDMNDNLYSITGIYR